VECPHLFCQLVESAGRDGLVVQGVVADFKPVAVELGDLFPAQVVPLVGAKIEALGDEEGGAEAVLFQKRASYGEVRVRGVVERQHHQLVGDGFQAPSAANHASEANK